MLCIFRFPCTKIRKEISQKYCEELANSNLYNSTLRNFELIIMPFIFFSSFIVTVFLYMALIFCVQNEFISNITLRSLYCKKTARNFSLIILSHNLGTSLRQNHKKIWGSPALIQRYDFLKFNMGSYGDFYFVAI